MSSLSIGFRQIIALKSFFSAKTQTSVRIQSFRFIRGLSRIYPLFIVILILFLGIILATPLLAQEGKCLRGDCDSGRGVFRWADGNRYEGNWRNGAPHGRGTMFYAKNGNRYAGQWRQGFWHGQGRLSFQAGGSYTGNFRTGLFSGKGRRIYLDGSIYDGTWRRNRWDGTGIITWDDGAKYSGQFRAGKMIKTGTYFPALKGGINRRNISVDWRGRENRICILPKCRQTRSLYLSAYGERSKLTAKKELKAGWQYTDIELLSKSKTSGYFLFYFPELSHNVHGFLPPRTNPFGLLEANFSSSFTFSIILGKSSDRVKNVELTYSDTTYPSASFFRGQLIFGTARLRNFHLGYSHMLVRPRAYRVKKKAKGRIRGSHTYGVSTGLVISMTEFGGLDVEQTFPVLQPRDSINENAIGGYIAFHYLAGFGTKSGKYESIVGLTIRANLHFATNFNAETIRVDRPAASANDSWSFSVNLGTRF